MKNKNFYNLNFFERFCLISCSILKFLLFIYSLQYGFIHESTENINIVLFVISKIVCVILIGSYLANKKINEKTSCIIENNNNKRG